MRIFVIWTEWPTLCRIDEISRQLFPASYLLTNLVYWVFYLYLAEDWSYLFDSNSCYTRENYQPLPGRGLTSVPDICPQRRSKNSCYTRDSTQPLTFRGQILCSRHLSSEKIWEQLLHSWLCTAQSLLGRGLILCSRHQSSEKIWEQLLHSWLCTVSTWQRTDPLFPTSILREDLRTAVTLVTLPSLYLAEDWSCSRHLSSEKFWEHMWQRHQPLYKRIGLLKKINRYNASGTSTGKKDKPIRSLAFSLEKNSG